MADTSAATDRVETVGERSVQVVISIRPEGTCFMDHLEGEIADVELHFPDGDCHCDVTVCREDRGDQSVEVYHHTGSRCECCPGVVFSRYDLVPHFLDRTEEAFVVRTYLPADHQLSELVADLRTVSKSVRVLRLLSNDETEAVPDEGTVDLSRLTAKQRAALERAVEAGYYESPPDTSLAALADDLDISPSAMSQRIARAEEHVLTDLFSD